MGCPPGHDQSVRSLGIDHGQGIGPLVLAQPAAGPQASSPSASAAAMRCTTTSVSVSEKHDAGCLQFIPQLVVFNNGVHQRYPVAAGVGVGVDLAGRAVGGPAGVEIPVRPAIGPLSSADSMPLLSLSLAHPKLAGAIDYRQTRRVVTAVLQAPQALQQISGTSRWPTAAAMPHTSVLFTAGGVSPIHYVGGPCPAPAGPPAHPRSPPSRQRRSCGPRG